MNHSFWDTFGPNSGAFPGFIPRQIISFPIGQNFKKSSDNWPTKPRQNKNRKKSILKNGQNERNDSSRKKFLF
jgi:hypothetical protein